MKQNKSLKKVIILFFLILSSTLSAKTVLTLSYLGEKLEVTELIKVDNVIWGMDFIDKENLIFTQKSGLLSILNLKTKEIRDIKHNLNIFNVGQGGLLDIKVSPTYEKDKTIFITYSKRVSNMGATTLVKARLEKNVLFDIVELLETKSLSDKGYHFGSRITFDKDGHIFFSIGDRGFRMNSQNLSNHSGSIIRLNQDGTIPKDNPFFDNNMALKEIYSYGHRNPQGLFYDKKRDVLFSIEHGPRGGDEINIIEKGKNYGWPVISYGKEYWNSSSVGEGTFKEGMEQPIKVYIPSIAPSSIIVYQGERLKTLKGKLLSTALKLQHLNIITLDKNLKVIKEHRVLEELQERLRNVIQTPFETILISTDSGKILEVK